MTWKGYVLLLLGPGVVLAAVAVIASLTLPGTPGVTERNYYRIHEGMTASEVEKLLGMPGLPTMHRLQDTPTHLDERWCEMRYVGPVTLDLPRNEITVYYGLDSRGNMIVIGTPTWKGRAGPELVTRLLRYWKEPPDTPKPERRAGTETISITNALAVALALASFFLGLAVGGALVWWFRRKPQDLPPT
jgi:hypothetical protein